MVAHPHGNRPELQQGRPASRFIRPLSLDTSNTKARQLHEAQRVCALGGILAAQGRLNEAVAHYERALALKPDYAPAQNSLGNALWAQGSMDAALECYERALVLKPDYAEANNNLGLALMARGHQGDADRAVLHYERALTLNSCFPEAHFNLANLLSAQGWMGRAVSHLEQAIELRPDYAEAHSNLGNLLCARGESNRAAGHCERALALRPNDALAHNNLGNALLSLGRINEAVAHYERALALRPDFGDAHSNLLLALNYESDRNAEAVHAAHLDYARRLQASATVVVPASVHDYSPGKRLKIGYVSSDFRKHSVAHFIEPVLSHHDRDRFEIFCYYNNPQEDACTKRMQTYADHWRRIFGLSDDAAVHQIQLDRIDILVDLNGHTAHNRLPVFACKPAPIQVTWLGYPNTTGLSTMDYRLTDRFADPVGMTEHLHSEELVRLPDCFSCYQPPQNAPEVCALPAREGGWVTFGSFNNLAKITRQVMAVWAEILHAVPGSRLTLKSVNLGEKATKQLVRDRFAALGIAPERLLLLDPERSLTAHLEQYGKIDIGLDPFPYNGATTTCEALWMGVPVITLAGTTHAGRVGVSQLSNLGLNDFIAHTSAEYVNAAVSLANDLKRLSTLRAELRSRLATSPLTNARCFTDNLEHAYLAMWTR
ncbi:MAG: O-linked N-acetylglucosamine transferase, SPINDLY family protein [Acidiferrobacterales bacterium]